MTPDIWAYSLGFIFLIFVAMFAYYSLRNARAMKGSLGHRYIAIGATFFVSAGVLDGIAMFAQGSMQLRLISFFTWIIAIGILIYAGSLIGIAMQKVYSGSLTGIFREHPGSILNLIGISALILIEIPIYILDLVYTPLGKFSWLFITSIAVSAFCFANLAFASRLTHLSDIKPGTEAGEELPVRQDILSIKAYGNLINSFLQATKSVSVGFGEAMEEYFEYNPILFEGCSPNSDGTIDIGSITKNVDRIYRENRVQEICLIFSALSCKLLDLYGAVTSPKHAEELLTSSYLAMQDIYGKSSVLFDILRSLPSGVLQKERITLLSRKELEARVSERTRELEASLAEKVVLLKEIHHRVKNNLQIISSLLNLQAGYIEDEAALQMFKESQNRVRSMALIHEKLYQSEDLAEIDFAEYIRDLANYLFRMYGTGRYGIKLNVKIEDISLGIDAAIPCGLIVNELISNSLKYAFPIDNKASSEQMESGGEIRVELRSIDNGNFVLAVGDTGTGFPEDLDFRETESLGLQLVNTLTEQLDGEIELDRSIGTEFRIIFGNPTEINN